LEFLLCTLTPEIQCQEFHRNHVIWRTKIIKFWRNGDDSKQFSVKDISIKLCYLYQRLQCRDFFKIKFVFFLYLRLSASPKENDLPLCIYFWYQTDSGVPNTSIYSAVSLASPYYIQCYMINMWNTSNSYTYNTFKYIKWVNTVVSNHVNSDNVPSFSLCKNWYPMETSKAKVKENCWIVWCICASNSVLLIY
jgi:hypothetical protein